MSQTGAPAQDEQAAAPVTEQPRDEGRWLVLGLGNPGQRYAGTRHNVGFDVLELMARRLGVAGSWRDECNSRVVEDGPLMLAMPQTFMNRSGLAARCLQERHGFAPGQILVVYDEVHLPLGKIRLRRAGSPAGHRGLESILESLGTDGVPRLRLGIAPELAISGEDLVRFVLDPFHGDEKQAVSDEVERAADAALSWAREGIDTAMQRFNG